MTPEQIAEARALVAEVERLTAGLEQIADRLTDADEQDDPRLGHGGISLATIARNLLAGRAWDGEKGRKP